MWRAPTMANAIARMGVASFCERQMRLLLGFAKDRADSRKQLLKNFKTLGLQHFANCAKIN